MTVNEIDMRILAALHDERGARATANMIAERLHQDGVGADPDDDDYDERAEVLKIANRLAHRYNAVLGPEARGWAERPEDGLYQLTDAGMDAAAKVVEHGFESNEDRQRLRLALDGIELGERNGLSGASSA